MYTALNSILMLPRLVFFSREETLHTKFKNYSDTFWAYLGKMLALSYYTILADMQVYVVRLWMEAPQAVFIEEEEVNLEWGRGRSLITLFRSHELRVFEVYRIEHFSRLSSDPLQSTVSVIFRSRSTGPWIRPLREEAGFRTLDPSEQAQPESIGQLGTKILSI